MQRAADRAATGPAGGWSLRNVRRLLTPRVTLGARIAVGLVFVLAGASKLLNPGSFSATLLAYDVLPVAALRPVSLILPWAELVVGLYLLAGLFTRAAAGAAIAMLAVFMGAIGQALLRGLSLEDCGCFGSITSAVPALQYVLGGSSLGPADLVRDAVYGALALLVVVGPPSLYSADGLLAAGRRGGAPPLAQAPGKNPTRSGTGAETARKPMTMKAISRTTKTPK